MLYKAQIWCGWRNRITSKRIDLVPGQVLEFDEGDFQEPSTRSRGEMTSLEDVLARGLFTAFDPDHAGDPEYMSRDEMLYILRKHDVGGKDGADLPHNADAGQLRPLVVEALEKAAGRAKAAAGGKGRRRKAGGN